MVEEWLVEGQDSAGMDGEDGMAGAASSSMGNRMKESWSRGVVVSVGIGSQNFLVPSLHRICNRIVSPPVCRTDYTRICLCVNGVSECCISISHVIYGQEHRSSRNS